MTFDHVTRAVAVVEAATELRLFLAGVPEAVLMPFAKEHHKHYLCIVLPIQTSRVNREAIADFCSHCISVLASSGVLQNLEGVELLLTAAGRRLVRLSVFSHALERAKQLLPTDIDGGAPVPGMTCIIYQQWPAEAQPVVQRS